MVSASTNWCRGVRGPVQSMFRSATQRLQRECMSSAMAAVVLFATLDASAQKIITIPKPGPKIVRVGKAAPAVRQSLPLVTSSGPSDRLLLNDQPSAEKKWYLPRYTVTSPAEGGFLFRIWPTGKYTETSEPELRAQVSLVLTRAISPDGAKAWIPLKLAKPSMILAEVPLTNLTGTLVVDTVSAETGLARQTSYPGVVRSMNSNAISVTFDLPLNALKSTYQNIAKGNGAKLRLAATYSAWTATSTAASFRQVVSPVPIAPAGPVLNSRSASVLVIDKSERVYRQPAPRPPPAPSQFIRREIPWMAELLIAYDCRKYPSVYVFEELNRATNSIGCSSHWSNLASPSVGWQKVSLSSASANSADSLSKVDVFMSLREENVFLLIPRMYRIAREDTPVDGQAIERGAKLFVQQDVHQPKDNIANLRCIVAADLSEYDLAQIRQALHPHLRGRSVPVLRFPTQLASVNGLALRNPVCDCPSGEAHFATETPPTLAVSLPAMPINVVPTLLVMLKKAGISAAIAFDIGDGLIANSTVSLGFSQLAGETAIARPAAGLHGIELTNRSKVPVTVDALVFHAGANSTISNLTLLNPILLDTNESKTIAMLNWPAGLTNVTVRNIATADSEKVLTVFTSNVDDIHQDMTLTTNIDFAKHGISQLIVEFELTGTSAKGRVTMDAVHPDHLIELTLPVDQYLSRRVISCFVTKVSSSTQKKERIGPLEFDLRTSTFIELNSNVLFTNP